ncbi:MAG TPA: hypothetical protein VK152_06425 [Paludibacter sp.]|nr:hypothetical protein [Paludibacter sp.]
MRNRIIYLSIITLSFHFQSIAQTGKSMNFIGLNPSVTVEPFYEKGELDVNVFPLVFQKTLTKRVDIRASTTVNYGIRNSANTISHLGGQLAFPIFLQSKENLLAPSQKFFVAPGIGFTRNLLEKHSNIGLWIEPGYSMMISENWSISFGVQLGATHFDYDNNTQKWGNHFGVKIIIGKWF